MPARSLSVMGHRRGAVMLRSTIRSSGSSGASNLVTHCELAVMTVGHSVFV